MPLLIKVFVQRTSNYQNIPCRGVSFAEKFIEKFNFHRCLKIKITISTSPWTRGLEKCQWQRWSVRHATVCYNNQGIFMKFLNHISKKGLFYNFSWTDLTTCATSQIRLTRESTGVFDKQIWSHRHILKLITAVTTNSPDMTFKSKQRCRFFIPPPLAMSQHSGGSMDRLQLRLGDHVSCRGEDILPSTQLWFDNTIVWHVLVIEDILKGNGWYDGILT